MKREEFLDVIKKHCEFTCRQHCCDLFGNPDAEQSGATTITVRIGEHMKKADYKKFVKWIMKIGEGSGLTLDEMDEIFTDYVYDTYEDILINHPDELNKINLLIK